MVLQSYSTVVTKRELSRKAKLSVYRAIFARTLTYYGHEVWVMTKRIRLQDLQIQVAKISLVDLLLLCLESLGGSGIGLGCLSSAYGGH